MWARLHLSCLLCTCRNSTAAAMSPLSLAIVTAHAHRLGLAPRLRRHCMGVGVRLLLRVWDTRSPVSRGQQEAAAQEIEARAAKHLALEHFETIDVSFHGTRTPGGVPLHCG
jgi:hypothetical protein